MFCPSVYEPVCGSDGNTYYSSCHLRQEQCRIRVNQEAKELTVCGITLRLYTY